jgi:hypothetical protein
MRRTMNLTRSRIDLPDLSGGTKSIKRICFELGNAVPFPLLERDRATFGPLVKAIHKPRSIRRIAAITASQCRLKFIQAGVEAHVISLT